MLMIAMLLHPSQGDNEDLVQYCEVKYTIYSFTLLICESYFATACSSSGDLQDSVIKA